MKKFGLPLCMLLSIVATTSGFAHAASFNDIAQARLRVTADATVASEHIALPAMTAGSVGAEYSVSATIERLLDDQVSAIIWRVENTSGRTLRNVRLFPMVDVDLDAADDSFLDERAAVSELGLHRPAVLTPDAWDAGELGYWHGDLLARVRADALQSPDHVVEAEDQALVWRFVSGDWFAGAVATLRLDVGPQPTPGIYVLNSDARRVYVEAQLALRQPDNQSPTVSISAPASGETFDIGSVIHLDVAAGDEDGIISQVEVFANGESIGVITGSGPYLLDYTATTAGALVFTAIATDDRGAATTSAAVDVAVQAVNIAPVIALTAPTDGSTVDVGAHITVSAAATDSDGTITQVEFFANGVSIGVVAGSGPHAVDYTATIVGSVVFTAIATDDRGAATTSAAVDVAVQAVNIAPVIALTAPTDGSTVDVGAHITVTAAATDSDGTITQVEFFANGVSIGVVAGSGPHAVDYTAAIVGSTVFTAIATDDRGAATSSAPISITVRREQVEFEADTDLTRDHRVLVWMSCDSPAPPQTEAACVTDRSLYLHELLNQRGVEHRIVHGDADFLAALRCGLYNTYWISGGVGRLSKASIDEIGANLVHGHALIVDARHDERNHGLDTYLGAQSTGRLGDAVPVGWTSGDGHGFGFPAVTAARRNTRSGAEALGYFNNLAVDAAVLRQRNALGTALWFAFDWVDAARAANQDQALFDQTDAIFATAPVVLTQPLAAGTHVGLTSVVRNTSNTTQTLILRGQWPHDLVFSQGLDRPDTVVGDTATWTLELAPQSERAIDWGLRLPVVGGEFVIETRVSDASGLHVEQLLTLRSSDGASRASVARAMLLALNLSGQNAAKRTLAMRAIDDTLAAIAAAQTSTALGKALDAIGRTREISALGTEPALVELGLLVRSLEATLCQNAQPACPAGIVASGTVPFAPALPDAGWQVARQHGAFVHRAGASLANTLTQPIMLSSAQTYRWRLTREGGDRLLAQVRDTGGDLVGEAQSAQGLIYGDAVRVSGSGHAGQVSLSATAVDGVDITAASMPMDVPQIWFAPGWQRIEGEFTLTPSAGNADSDFVIQWQTGELACRQP